MLGCDGLPCNTHSMSVLRGKLSWVVSWAQLQLEMKNTILPKALCITTVWNSVRRGDRGQESRLQAGLESKDRWWLCVMGMQGRFLWIMHFNSIVSHKKPVVETLSSVLLKVTCSTDRDIREPKMYLAGKQSGWPDQSFLSQTMLHNLDIAGKIHSQPEIL